MNNATIVLNWVDRFGNGYGYVANAFSDGAGRADVHRPADGARR
jgi:hypothetical protein